MKFFNRGLYALVLTLILQSQLAAQYLYKDEVVNRPTFNDQVEELGSELFEKTAISLKLVMLKQLPVDTTMVEYEKTLLKEFSTPTILMTFSEKETEIDIQVNEKSLYKYFDRHQVLSPNASAVQAFVMALVYSDSWKSFNEIRTDYGGSILPLLAGKAKNEQIVGKYAASMFNGYIDIAQQVSHAKGIQLVNDPGDANQEALFYLKLLFYSIVLYAIVMLIKRSLYRRRHKNEHNQ